MTNEPDNPVKRWTEFIKTSKPVKKQIAALQREFPFLRSLYIDYRDVEKFGSSGLDLADEILDNPGTAIEALFDAISTNNLIKLPNQRDLKKINIRFVGIGKRSTLRDIRYDDVDRILSIESVVIRASEVRPRINDAVFKCPAGHFTTKPQYYGKFIEPTECGVDGCRAKRFELIPKRSTFTNQQKIRIQEISEKLKPGQQPQAMDVIALDDICDQIFPGDRVVLNGIVRSVQRVVRGEKSTVFDLYLELQSIEAEERNYEEVVITEESEQMIREIAKSEDVLNQIVKSIAPTIYGVAEIKTAIALQLFGGITKCNDDGTESRGYINVLIVGDPGSAKSKLIRHASRLSPRGFYASMKSASAAGLTGFATKDDEGKWVVEAGTLALCDEGLGAIDEIDKADDDVRDALYEVMEDGIITISKAAHRSMRARTSILGAANPKFERFDQGNALADQINMKPAFLSRFDLIFIMPDNPDDARDAAIAGHIVTTHRIGEYKAAGKSEKVTEEERAAVLPPIPPHLLRQYIAYARRNITPIMTKAAMETLTSYYQKTRALASQGRPVPITARALEATIRLTEALARIRLAQDATIDDANQAIRIFDACIREVATDPKTGQLNLEKIGGGKSQKTINMIGAIKEVIKSEPGLSLNLLLSKMAERSYSDETAVRNAIETLKSKREVYEPRFEHYKLM